MNTNYIMEDKTKLELWLDLHSEKRNFEELFFILVSTIDSKNKDSISLYKKLKDYLIISLEHSQYSSSSNYKQTFLDTNKKTNILSCIDILLEINGGKILTTNRELSAIEDTGGLDILIKHKVNLKQKNYLNFKFERFCNKKSMDFRNIKPTHAWLENFLLELHEVSENVNLEIAFKKANNNLLMFCAAIELGYEPSTKEIVTMFDTVWQNTLLHKINNLSYFCDAFSKTNVFKNSLAPARNIDTLIKNFFKDYLINCDSNQEDISESIALHNDKLYMLFNHPAFLHENIQKQIIRKNAQRFLGKTLLNKEEIDFVQNAANQEKPKSRKIKI